MIAGRRLYVSVVTAGLIRVREYESTAVSGDVCRRQFGFAWSLSQRRFNLRCVDSVKFVSTTL